VSFYAVARQRLLNEYLRSGDMEPIRQLSKHWNEIATVPLAHCYVSSYYQPGDSNPMYDIGALFSAKKRSRCVLWDIDLSQLIYCTYLGLLFCYQGWVCVRDAGCK